MLAHEIVEDYELDVETHCEGMADDDPCENVDDFVFEWEEFLWEQEVEEPARHAAVGIGVAG